MYLNASEDRLKVPGMWIKHSGESPKTGIDKALPQAEKDLKCNVRSQESHRK